MPQRDVREPGVGAGETFGTDELGGVGRLWVLSWEHPSSIKVTKTIGASFIVPS
jgi:hypothetical protein